MKRVTLVGWTVFAWVAAFTYLAVAKQVPQAPVVQTTSTIEALGHFAATFGDRVFEGAVMLVAFYDRAHIGCNTPSNDAS